jgi:hypothetical protein
MLSRLFQKPEMQAGMEHPKPRHHMGGRLGLAGAIE